MQETWIIIGIVLGLYLLMQVFRAQLKDWFSKSVIITFNAVALGYFVYIGIISFRRAQTSQGKYQSIILSAFLICYLLVKITRLIKDRQKAGM